MGDDEREDTLVVDEPVAVMVTVGTDHHPFDRLIRWIDEWRDDHPEVHILVQRGTSRPSRHGSSPELVPYEELCELFRQSTVVVSHGGPATIMDALAAGRLPIVVPRDPGLGEHIDGHQLSFAEHLRRRGLGAVATTKAELSAAIDRALADPDSFAVSVHDQVSDGVARFAEIVDEMLDSPNAGR